MSPSAFDPVVVEVRLPASPEQVFPHLTEADKLSRWLAGDVIAEAIAAGPFSCQWGPETIVRGRFVELAAPTRLVISWGRAGDPEVPPESSRVEIGLTQDEPGNTALRLVHRDLPLEYRQEHLDFWAHHLTRLSEALSDGTPGSD